MAQLTLAAIQALLADNETGDITPADIRSVIEGVYSPTGWADYVDTQYTSGSPFAVTADTDTALPNNAGTVRDTYKPVDVTEFYDGTVITGREGDGINITFEARAITSSASGAYIEIWLDIGGAVGEIYRGIWGTFPKGNNIEAGLLRSFSAYTLDTWESNGATVYVRSNVAMNLYDIRYVITRTSRANV